MRSRHDVDVVVIGGGAGGLTAAQHAARRGARVVLVADGPLGGDCTHTGCIPSKTLIAAAAAGRGFTEAMDAVHATVERVARTEDEAAMAARGITVLRGRAELEAPTRVRVGSDVLVPRHVVLATGAGAALPPVPGLEETGVLTNATVFDLRRRPATMAVVGGGSIGCELAQAFARLDVAVTVLEAADRVLPGDDCDASALIDAALRADGVVLRTGARLTAARRVRDRRCLDLADGTSVEAEEVLVATGRRPETTGLGIDRAGVALDAGGRIVVDRTCATNVPGVWAVGDVTTLGGFTHVAAHMGFVTAVNVTRPRLRPAAKVDVRVVPRVTFTDPEVASVGATEESSTSRGARVAELQLRHVDRAVTSAREAGFVKLLVGPRPVLRNLGGGRVLGGSVVAPRAGEMIAEIALAMRTRAFTGRLAQTIHAYPTWSAAIQQAAAGLFFDVDGVDVRAVRR